MPTTPIHTDRRLRELIRLSRKQCGLSQHKAADIAQISGVWWRRIESGAQATAPAATLARMCKAAGISAGILTDLGYTKLAELTEHLTRLDEGTDGREDDAEDYLWAAPVDDTTRRALVGLLRSLKAVEAEERSDPLADELLRTRRRRET